jgi:hypothetical protein
VIIQSNNCNQSLIIFTRLLHSYANNFYRLHRSKHLAISRQGLVYNLNVNSVLNDKISKLLILNGMLVLYLFI